MFGRPFYAPAAGTVTNFPDGGGYGLWVMLDHGDGIFSAFAHMNTQARENGDVVEQGDVIGQIGMTGKTTGPHVHWAVSTEPRFPRDTTILRDPASYTEDPMALADLQRQIDELKLAIASGGEDRANDVPKCLSDAEYRIGQIAEGIDAGGNVYPSALESARSAAAGLKALVEEI